MTPRRLLSLWLGVLGEMLLITSEVVEPTEPHFSAIDEIVQRFVDAVGYLS